MKKTDIQYIHDLLTKLDDRLDDLDTKFDTKLSVLDQRLHNLDKTADLQRVSLEYHIKRTDLLESDLNSRTSEIKTTLQPIVKHVNTVRNYSTLVAKVAAAAGLLATLWAAFRG